MPANSKILASIAKNLDPKKLWTQIENAEKEKNAVIADAAFRQLISLVPDGVKEGTAEYDFWRSINALEFRLSKENRKTTRLSKTRQKIERVGEIETLKELALRKAPAEGFEMMLKRNMVEFAAEAVILRHPKTFGEEVCSAARERLTSAGIDISEALKPQR